MNPFYLADGIEIHQSDKSTYICYHAGTSRYFKISEHLYFVLKHIEKGTSIESIRDKYEKLFGVIISMEDLQHRLSVLDNKILTRKPHGESQLLRKGKPNYLKLSHMIVDESTLNRVTPLFSFLFLPAVSVFILCAFLFLTSYAIFANYSNIILFYSNTPSAVMLWYIIYMVVSTMWHEIGHATACRYFGARHGGIGVGFYLLSPVMYADVSDSWRLPKWSRIYINMAGIYFEIIAALIMVGGFYITNNIYILTLSIITIAKLGVNLNPFFRTDGYWVLSDFLNIPNLRYRSNSTLKHVTSNITARHNSKSYLLALYSLGSYAFIGLFLYYVLFEFEGSLIYFPLEMLEMINDYQRGLKVTMLDLGIYLQNIVIPVMFYYFLLRFVRDKFTSKT